MLGIGCCAVDELLYVESYPPADSKTRVLRSERRVGGLAGTALIAAARLGAKCAFGGRLGVDADSRYVEEKLSAEGIDTSTAPRSMDHAVGHSTIIVAPGSRNVFSEIRGAMGAHDGLPAREVIESSRVLLIDHHGVPGALRAARIARQNGTAVVADFERADHPDFGALLDSVDHLILSESFALRLTGQPGAMEAVGKLAASRTVVVTCGPRGGWAAGPAEEPWFFPAFEVETVDTTGCGDVFHGAYAAALAAGFELRERLRRAAAAAAIHAAQSAEGERPPTKETLERFLS